MGKQKKTNTTTYQVRISNTAIQNLNEITGYIAFVHQSPLNAIKVGDAFFTLFDRIEKNPFAFKECPELLTSSKIYRQAVCHSWLVIYKITLTEIIILGIIHGSRKPSKLKFLLKVK